MSWQTAIPAGKAKQRPPRSQPGQSFTNRHSFTLQSCACGTSILPTYETCVVCEVNTATEKRVTARKAAAA